MKKFYIIILVLVIIAAAIVIYRLFFRTAPCDPAKPGYDTNGKANPKCAAKPAAQIDLGQYCKQHPEDVTQCNSSTDCYNGCLSSKPGYDCNNQISSYC